MTWPTLVGSVILLCIYMFKARRQVWFIITALGLVLAMFAVLLTVEAKADFEQKGSCVGAIRAVHIIPNKLSLEDFKRLVDVAKTAGFCSIVVGIRSGLDIESISVESHVKTLDKSTLQAFKKYASQVGIDLIPEIKLLTHQEQFLKQLMPHGMYNLTTYNPNDKKIKELVKKVVLELIEILDPPAFHIGHDEVSGSTPYSRKKYLRNGEEMLPAKEYLDSVLFLNQIISEKDIDVWMWGDMLISADEAPKMRSKHFHGGFAGYGKPLRDLIPKNIIILDWHYKDKTNDFFSVKLFVDSGLRVLGATYNNVANTHNFTKSAKTLGASGMISTNWDFAIDNNMSTIIDRMVVTGRIFKRHFK